MRQNRRQKEKIGIFGGSFNPVHNGHIAICEGIARIAGLDRVLLIPVASPPHKGEGEMVSGEHRLAMLRLATEGHPHLEVSDLELRRGGKSYTVDTLFALRQQHPDGQFYLLMGADMFLTLHQWKNFEQLIQQCVICTMVRGSDDEERLRRYAQEISLPGERLLIAPMERMDVSSTLVRTLCRRGEDVGDFVPPKVKDYLAEHHLYR